jgi:hypothetical protein
MNGGETQNFLSFSSSVKEENTNLKKKNEELRNLLKGIYADLDNLYLSHLDIVQTSLVEKMQDKIEKVL